MYPRPAISPARRREGTAGPTLAAAGGGWLPFLSGHRLNQRGNLERGEVGKSVGDGIGQNNPAVVAQGSAGIDHIWYIALPLGRFGANKGRARSRQNL